jgi:hypothetical protein
MNFDDDFDFGDLLGLGLAIGEEFAEEERERLRIEQDHEDDPSENLLDEQ